MIFNPLFNNIRVSICKTDINKDCIELNYASNDIKIITYFFPIHGV
jgi:hypothetical protein